MKRLFLCILVMLTAVLSYAQSEQAEFKGGIGMSSLTGSNSDGFGETVSWKAGFGFDFPIWGDLYVQPSLMVVSKGFKGYALTTTFVSLLSSNSKRFIFLFGLFKYNKVARIELQVDFPQPPFVFTTTCTLLEFVLF